MTPKSSKNQEKCVHCWAHYPKGFDHKCDGLMKELIQHHKQNSPAEGIKNNTFTNEPMKNTDTLISSLPSPEAGGRLFDLEWKIAALFGVSKMPPSQMGKLRELLDVQGDKDRTVYSKAMKGMFEKGKDAARERIAKKIEREIKDELNLEVCTGLSVALGIVEKI